MPRRTSRGQCSFCGRSFGKGAMARHLRTCKERAAATAAAGPAAASFHLVVEGREQPEYWLHLEVPARMELQLLDDFLRFCNILLGEVTSALTMSPPVPM